MSTQSLRELVEAIKGQGKTLAGAQGATAATARDLVYLSTSVERLFGADAILELIDSAARPVEHLELSLASSNAQTLTVDQVTKQVIRVTNTSPTFSATDYTITIPERGVAFVVDNELTIPIKVKTSTQTTNIPSIAAGETGWVFCDGNVVEFVVDVAAITSALTSVTQDPGDMIYRSGVPVNSYKEFNVTTQNWGTGAQFYFSGESREFGSPYNVERTPNLTLYPSVTYKFDTSNDTMTGHTLKFSITQDGTNNSGVELLDLDADTNIDVTYVGTPGTAGAYTQIIVPATGSPATIYYYCSVHAGMGGDGVVTIATTTGVTKLPIGNANNVLSVDAFGEKPTWVQPKRINGVKGGVACLAWDFTGAWSDGEIKLANHITDATIFPHAANKGTYDSSKNQMQGYRGTGLLYWDNGSVRQSVFGSNTEGRTGQNADSNHTFSSGGLAKSSDGQFGYQGSDGYPNLYAAKQVCTAHSGSAYVDTGGNVWMTGHGDEGQIGDGALVDRLNWFRANIPTSAGRARYVHSTTSGTASSVSWCALMENGDVYSWGAGVHSQTGQGSTSNTSTPTKINALSNIRSITSGGGDDGTWAAIDTSNNLWMWGRNGDGQCGNGSTTDISTPTQINVASQPVVKVVIQGFSDQVHTLVMTANGRCYAMGYNGVGQLGDGSTTSRNTPTLVSNLGLNANQYVIDIWAMAGQFGCSFFLTDNGDMYACGKNNRGMLGVGDTADKAAPTIMVDNIKWCSEICTSGTSDSTSYYYNQILFLSHDNLADRMARVGGTVRSAGYTNNAMGKGGRPTNETSPRPIILQMQGKIRFIAMWGYHTSNTQEMCAGCVDENGKFWTWGYSSSNSLGGNPANYTPALVRH
jgi:alpha-tubulin suppressor-like RCC1 family protein